MASRSVNKVILLGHLGRDAETRFTPSGAAVTRFSVATSRRWKDQQTGDWKEETDWHNVTLWRAENLANYLTKGTQVYIEGRLQTRSYEDKDGQKKYSTEVIADPGGVILVGGRGQGGGAGAGGGDDWGDMAPAGGGGGGGRGTMVSMPRGQQPQRGSGGGASQEPDLPPVIEDDDVPF